MMGSAHTFKRSAPNVDTTNMATPGLAYSNTHLQSTCLLQDLLQFTTLLLGHSVVSTTNELATNKHTRNRPAPCQLVQVVLNGIAILPLVQL